MARSALRSSESVVHEARLYVKITRRRCGRGAVYEFAADRSHRPPTVPARDAASRFAPARTTIASAMAYWDRRRDANRSDRSTPCRIDSWAIQVADPPRTKSRYARNRSRDSLQLADPIILPTMDVRIALVRDDPSRHRLRRAPRRADWRVFRRGEGHHPLGAPQRALRACLVSPRGSALLPGQTRREGERAAESRQFSLPADGPCPFIGVHSQIVRVVRARIEHSEKKEWSASEASVSTRIDVKDRGPSPLPTAFSPHLGSAAPTVRARAGPAPHSPSTSRHATAGLRIRRAPGQAHTGPARGRARARRLGGRRLRRRFGSQRAATRSETRRPAGRPAPSRGRRGRLWIQVTSGMVLLS